MTRICYKWGNCDVKWKDANWLWSECQLVAEIIELVGNRPGVDATTLIQPWLNEPYSPYRAGEKKKKRLIKLICRVKGIEYNEEKMSKDDFKITASDIKLVVKAVSGVDLQMKD